MAARSGRRALPPAAGFASRCRRHDPAQAAFIPWTQAIGQHLNIRTRLRALILATLMPVIVLGAGAAYYLVEKERKTLERGVTDRAGALMTAIDAELRSSIAPLELLARAPSLQRGDLPAFRIEAQRALAASRGRWINILVSQAESAEMLLNLLIAQGAPLPPAADSATILEAARSHAPTVSQVAMGAVVRRPLFAVRVPVVRDDGKVPYVISAVVEIAAIEALIAGQDFPPGWAIAVVDGNFRFVARRPKAEGMGDFASDSLKQAIRDAKAGWHQGRMLDGTEIYRAVQPSSVGRWALSIAVFSSVVDQGLRGLWLLIAGFAGAACLGLWIAWRLAARISDPLAALAAAAPAIGRGQAVSLPPSGAVREVQDLSRALDQAAGAIRDREERQRRAEEALRAADRAKDEFLAMLGHELRNPLASVSNAAQLLRLAQDQPAVLANVSDILSRQVAHMKRLVDDLLDAGRVTGGKITLARAPLELAGLVAQLAETWRGGDRFLHHEVRTQLSPVWVLADRARVEQIVSNLLDNALKYTPAGGKIELAVRPEGGEALFEVSDSGRGMLPELMARAFDLFAQGDRGLAREGGGLGIGLTMVKRLVELHGGAIRGESAGLGRGSAFTVRLPAIESRIGTARTGPALTLRGRRILVIEDNGDARESLAALLRFNGHEVRTAPNGTEGIAAAGAFLPEFALVDIGLPDLDGYEIARELRSDPATRSIRLIAMTGYGMPEDRRRALAAGFDEHLVKPADLESVEGLFRDLTAAAA